jgi:hypothetical protein
MNERMPQHQSYLLRLWPTNTLGKTVWQASLENARTGERLSFSSLDEMYAFLNQQKGSSKASPLKINNKGGD